MLLPWISQCPITAWSLTGALIKPTTEAWTPGTSGSLWVTPQGHGQYLSRGVVKQFGHQSCPFYRWRNQGMGDGKYLQFQKSNPDLRNQVFQTQEACYDQEDMNRYEGFMLRGPSLTMTTLEWWVWINCEPLQDGSAAHRALWGWVFKRQDILKTPGHNDNSSYIIFPQKISLL